MKRLRESFTAAVACWSLPCITARADDPARPVPEKLRIERLSAWQGMGHGPLHSPVPGLSRTRWDAALIKAIPKVEAAKTKAEYSSAVGDAGHARRPATGVVSHDTEAKPTGGELHPVWSWVDDKILIVRITNYLDLEQDFVGVRQKIERLKTEIRKAQGVVFDLRHSRRGRIPERRQRSCVRSATCLSFAKRLVPRSVHCCTPVTRRRRACRRVGTSRHS